VTVTPITSDVFAEWRKPRFGDANPTRLDNPLWASLVHDRISAWSIAKQYGFERFPGAGPTWCFDRFGQSTTLLVDGRTIYIGGEHEDYYDPDFFIYNDVVIVAPDGDVAIYGYPRDVFPPTDFHSATLFGDAIVIVGSLGYHDERAAGTTPVYRLALATKAIEPVATTGDPPGWIHKHTATLDGTMLTVSGGILETGDSLADNIDEWALDLATWRWTRRTKKDWQRFELVPPEGSRSHVWEIRQLLWSVEHPDFKGSVDYRANLIEAIGREPDLGVLRDLYLVDDETRLLERDDDEYNVFRIELDGVSVTFKEESYRVTALVEGRLSEARLSDVQAHVQYGLSELHNALWQLR
jgi:hypothetical protein